MALSALRYPLRLASVVPGPVALVVWVPGLDGLGEREGGLDGGEAGGFVGAAADAGELGVGIEVDDVGASLVTRQAPLVGGQQRRVIAPDGHLAERLGRELRGQIG